MTRITDTETTVAFVPGPVARRFSEGIEQLPNAASVRRVGRFSTGIEREPQSASVRRVGSFADGLGVAGPQRIGSFADGFTRPDAATTPSLPDSAPSRLAA
jgi:hypothetical protein